MIYGTNLLNFLVSHAITKNQRLAVQLYKEMLILPLKVYFFLQEAKCTNGRIHLLSTANTELRN